MSKKQRTKYHVRKRIFLNRNLDMRAFAIGIVVMTMARSIGHISGGHYNPAVTIGLVAGGRFPLGDAVPYIVAQCLGAIAATGVFSLIGNAPGVCEAALHLGRVARQSREHCQRPVRLPRDVEPAGAIRQLQCPARVLARFRRPAGDDLR